MEHGIKFIEFVPLSLEGFSRYSGSEGFVTLPDFGKLCDAVSRHFPGNFMPAETRSKPSLLDHHGLTFAFKHKAATESFRMTLLNSHMCY